MIVPRYVPGEWVAAVSDGAIVLLPAETSAATVERVWMSLREDDGLGDHLQVLLRDGLGSLPPFALVSLAAGRVQAVVRGAVAVEVETTDGVRVLSGAEVTTWSEATVLEARAVTVRAVTGDDADGAELPVLSGVVRASSVRVGLRSQAQPGVAPSFRADVPAQEQPVQQPVQPPIQPAVTGWREGRRRAPTVEDVPVSRRSQRQAAEEDAPEVAPAGEPQVADRPLPVTRDLRPVFSPVFAPVVPTPAPAVDPAPVSAPAPAPAPTSGPPAPSPVVHAPSPVPAQGSAPVPAQGAAPVPAQGAAQGVEAPAAVAVAEPEAPAGDVDHDGLTVLSTDVVELRRELPEWAGDAVPALTVPAPQAPPPAKIHLSSGLVIALNRPVLLGRAPQVSRVTNSRLPRLVTVASPNQDISRTHAEVRQEGEHVLVTDLRSTNGVLLLRQGHGPQRLHPGEPTVVEPGVVVDLGEGVTFVVEHGT